MEPRKLQGMSGFDINEAYRLLAASVEAAPRELSPPEATALSSQVTVHCSKEQGAFSSSPSVVMATVLPRGISSVGKTPSLTSKMVMVRPSAPHPALSSEAAPLPVEEPILQSTTINDQFPFPIPPSGTRMSPIMPKATTLHPQILKMLGLPPEQPRDASSGSVSVSETASPAGDVDRPSSSQQHPLTRPAYVQRLSKLKLSPVRQQRTTKLLLPKPPSSNTWSSLLPGNFIVPPQLQSVLTQRYPPTCSSPQGPALQMQAQGVLYKGLKSPTSLSVAEVRPSMSVAPLHSKPRRPCNCKASKCLKLYCDCFANGEFCRETCNCTNCSNNMQHERDRAAAIKSTLERNPLAFHPKVAKHKLGDTERKHIKGCHCKRSGCLKNYCECYEAKIPCSVLCKCIDCKNRPDSEMKSLLQLADAAESRPYQQRSHGSHLLDDLEQSTVRPVTKMGYGRKLPLAFVNQSVAEACVLCLLQLAAEGEQNGQDELELEKTILQEFGSCLEQIIQAASRASESQR